MTRAARLARWRRPVQAGVLLFYLALPLLHGRGWRQVSGNLAALRLGPLELAEPAAALSAALAALHVPLALALALALPLLTLLALGPVFCSWVCPWGLVSELLDRRRRGRARVWAPRTWEVARRPRRVTLVLVLLGSALLGLPLVAWLSPPRLLSALPQQAALTRAVPVAAGALLLALLALELLGPRRLLCRALCPVGALHAHLRAPGALGVRFDAQHCLCPARPHCQAVCAWGLDPRQMGRFDGCTHCLACVRGCPSGALGVGFGRARPANTPGVI